MSDREEWGPWTPAPGNGCPCIGKFAHVIYEKIARFSDGYVGNERMGLILRDNRSWWSNSGPGIVRITMYRIRTPRALQQLREMIETLPAPRQKEDA